MSEQIREQVSAFLDGELPNSEMELLLKRLTRDAELRESFGRYALIGETIRGVARAPLSRGFSARVNGAIDGAAEAADHPPARTRAARWWKTVAGGAVAASVATAAIVALQQRAIAPGVVAATPISAQNAKLAQSREAISYTVPSAAPDAPAVLSAARLTSYVFAHSKYSSGLGQSNVLSGLLADTDDQTQPSQPAQVVGPVRRAADAANDAAPSVPQIQRVAP